MKVDIFIRTYDKDLVWLKYCLKSIKKYMGGYNQIIVVIPNYQLYMIKHLQDEGVKVMTCPAYSNDYIGQQITKLKAYTYSKADMILYMDSDCIFIKETIPEDFMRNCKPILIKENYERLKGNKDAYARKGDVEKIVGFPVEFEYMRRHPLMYWRKDIELGDLFRKFNLDREGRQDVKGLENMSEFNILGAMVEEKARDRYCFVEVGKDDIPEARVKQYWSWGGLTDDIKKEIETHLKLY